MKLILDKFHLKKRVRKATRRSQCSSIENYVKDTLLRYTFEPINEVVPQTEGKIFFSFIIIFFIIVTQVINKICLYLRKN